MLIEKSTEEIPMDILEISITIGGVGLSIALAWICASLAKSKGRNNILWGILGFFFNVFALVIILLLPRK